MARIAGKSAAETVEAIRKAGIRLIYDHGFEAMSLRQLAKEVGIQAGSLYNHFSTKQEFLYDILKGVIEELTTEMERRLDGLTSPTERLEAFIAFHIEFHTARKEEVFIGNMELRSLEPDNYREIVGRRSAYERMLRRILEDGVAAGVFRVSDVKVATFALIAMLSWVCAWYRPDGRLSRQELARIYSELVFNGVTAPALPSEPPAGRQPAAKPRAKRPVG